MHFFKFAVSFLAVGGTTYALIKINEMPPWLIAVTVAMAFAAVITALPHLPEAIAALENAAKRLAPVRTALSEPARERPPSPYVPPRALPEYKPQVSLAVPQVRCAALVMSARGGWGGSAGSGLACAERLQRARTSCAAHSSSPCRSYAVGSWVAGIHCGQRMAHGMRHNSFSGYGLTEADAFARALQNAASQGFSSHACRRRVALSPDDATPRRYD